ncbi:ABC transporter ATP-binding protein [Enterococcus dongliensis]|uniref:ABC transporter ATP-binding protein n=1 Tax=Enterococcus dongliensis TaxID=2559925 RepID=A0AAP5KR34_9ENTE|nr:ABC transporter ATP-binding protein [Enterococcus dongliensis]MDT2596637.1 ABC transporter ATP-binding protein [Enterococcus dongliensis]MDT2634644.1 ABC transporter ATP-binding protein [Enterococcus dongliensis]MDT2637532.1 ABC transporter ATP-binding protein [Enterococcus dongliensis]MDT2642662.1 ABC transporter ATP-binding protein [Enterococcus dongliensis]MDT2647857.1 ABC transporter ATP-binding protein [Enterococcus dongliensis]
MLTKKNFFQSLKLFLPYLAAYPKELTAAILLGIASGVTSVLMTYYIGVAVDQMVNQGTVDFDHLFQILQLFIGIFLVTVVSQYLIQRLGNTVAFDSVAKLREETFTHLNQLPLSYYDQSSKGDIVSRFTNDMDNISTAISAIFNQLFSGMTVVLVAFVFMLHLSPMLTVVVLVATPIIFLLTYIVARTSQQYFTSQQQLVGSISGFITEMVSHQKIVKAFQRETQNQLQFEALNQELYVRGQKAQFASAITNPSSRFVDHLAYLMVGLVGGLLALKTNSGVTIGIISSFTIYSSQFTKPFIELSGITIQIQTAIAGLDRSFELLKEPIEQADAPTALALTEAKGKVVFDHVSFSYQKDQRLIEEFNLTVEPGETIAIVGKTGAGKSTLVNLLMRFYEVDQGKITIDGTDIRKLTRDSLRQQFGMVLQETWLMDSSLRANLRYGRKSATDEEIYAALNDAYMYDFVQRLPDKLDTIVGAAGIKLSDGQRQLLTIARTMISRPAMLILDEATSSVDTLTEQKIQRAFLAMMNNHTSFVIAHRLSTIQNADQILVLDHGKIVEIGNHQTLLEKDGYYKKLYQAQFSLN